MDIFHRPWAQSSLDAILRPFRGSEPYVFLLMGVGDYVDLRKSARDVLDVDSQPDWRKDSLSRYDGVDICPSRTVADGQISVVAACGVALAVLRDNGPVDILPGAAVHGVLCAHCLSHSVMAS